MSQKERIIEQAMQMFVTQGIKAVRMDDIAQQLSVSKRTLYELFGDKEELLFEAMCRYFEQCEANHTELTTHANDMLQALFMVLDDIMDHSETTNRMLDNLQRFYPAVYEKLMAAGRERHRGNFKECLEQGIADGLFLPDINLELSISVLYYTASALFTRKEFFLPEGISERDAFRQIVSSFFRGISTPKGIVLIDTYRSAHQTIEPEK